MSTLLLNQDLNFQKIYFGGGCFWCVEAIFEDVKGVVDVSNGYAGGNLKNPTYEKVCNGFTNHAEVCQITYDIRKINLENLLEIFFLTHDPTTPNRQGNDIGNHYRSIILFNNNTEQEIIEKFILHANKKWYNNNIVTEVKKYEIFYEAEKYHQGYFKDNTKQPYCNSIIKPKILKARKKLKQYY